ncbi:MAG: bile acid:sodium symporter [Myxococcota bacterium]|nr:bile acid:sodium symporter [Myxococcota bacterium]
MQLGAIVLLFALMAIVGLELTAADFRQVARNPRAVWVGALGQLTLLPLLVGGVLYATDFPATLVGGAILLTASPGAGVSNLFTLVGRGNVALSVTLTALGSLAAVAAIPLIVTSGFALLLGSELEIEVPVREMTVQLVFALLLPVGLGMWLRQRRPDLALRWKPYLGRIVAVGFVIIVAGAVLGPQAQAEEMATLIGPGLGLAVLWGVTSLAAGALTALAAGCRGPDAFAIVVEFAAKNGTVAFLVSLASLERLDTAFFVLPYVAVCYPAIGLLAWLVRRRHPEAVPIV